MELLTPPAFEATALREFVAPYERLCGDKRIFEGLQACVWGIIGSGSCKVSQIARHNPITGAVDHGERRLRRLLHGEHTRSQINAEQLGKVLSAEGAKLLAGEQEVLLVIDESDLRKPYSRKLEHLDTVRSLEGNSVKGYPTLTVLGIGASGQRALLYQRTFSSLEPTFTSLNDERKQAVVKVEQQLRQVLAGRFIWVMDRGFDDQSMFSFLQQRGSLFVVRVQHLERSCQSLGKRSRQSLASCLKAAPEVTKVFLEARLVTATESQKYLSLAAHLSTVILLRPEDLRLTALQLRHPKLKQAWTLLSNLSELPPDQLAPRLVQLYRMRWSIEDVFAWTKDALDWESAALLNVAAFKTLVAMAWLAAAFLFNLGITLDEPQLLLLAKLGGWTPSKRPPGKKLLTKGLAVLLDYWQVLALMHDTHKQSTLTQLIEDLLPP